VNFTHDEEPPMNLTLERFTTRWVLAALLYFVAAVALGIAMAASHDMRLKGLHVHLNLLGWVSMALSGVIYRLFPRAAASRLATLHFWLYQLALPVMMAGLAGLLLGQLQFEPLVAAGSALVGVAVMLFALAVWRAGRASAVGVDQLQPAA
jgi:hypothetical protein